MASDRSGNAIGDVNEAIGGELIDWLRVPVTRSFPVGEDEWQELVRSLDRPVQSKPELIDLFSRPRPR